MSTTTNTRKFKKRYVAAGALALLVAAGGTTGALVTQQSTMAGNNITVKEAEEAKLDLGVTGSPLASSVTIREDGYMSGISDTKKWMLTNNGNRTITVKVLPQENLILPSVGKPHTKVNLRVATTGANSESIFQQTISGLKDSAIDSPTIQETIKLTPGQTTEVAGYLTSILDDQGTDTPIPGSYDFDVKFDFVQG